MTQPQFSSFSDISETTPLPVAITGSSSTSTVAIDQTTVGTTDSVTVKASAGIGSLTETAPGTDTASSGLNGRLQRVAQRLTSLIALLPTALGQTTMAASLPVTLASNQSALPITDNSGSLTVDNAGTFAVQAASAGDVANDSADSGNPVKIGGQARTTNPTAVADADRVNAAFDKIGRQIVVTGHVRELTGVKQTTITSSVAETTIVTAVASTFLDLVNLSITNSSASATLVTLKDATAGTTRGIWSIAAGGGISISFPTPLAQAAVNNNWTITCGTSVASIYVVAQYVKNI